MTVKPNFFIVGAPKCGTTALSEYLRTHPNVFVPPHKEPGYFSDDVEPSQYAREEEYLALFAGASPEQKVVTDASTKYLHSQVALQRIKEFQPAAKLLVMLRRPSDLVYAFHSQMLRNGLESEWDFKKAWSMQAARATGKKLPLGAQKRSALLQYKWIGSLGTQVQRVFQLFDRSQVHFIFFDDFVSEPRREYLGLIDFLRIPDDGREQFPKANENVRFKSRAIARIPRAIRAALLPQMKAVKKLTGVRKFGIIQTLDRINAKPLPRPLMQQDFQEYLNELFSDEVRLLEDLLERDLSSWRTVANVRPTLKQHELHVPPH